MRHLLALLGLLFLSGCWIGDPLYTAADARPGIAPGRYSVVTPDGATKVMLVSLRDDGMTRIDLEDEPGDPSFVGFAPLDPAAGTSVGWWAPPGSSAKLAYGLLRRQADGVYLVLLPRCLETQAIAAAAGGTVTRPGTAGASCDFPGRASLETAMRALAASTAVNGPVIRFEPLPAR